MRLDIFSLCCYFFSSLNFILLCHFAILFFLRACAFHSLFPISFNGGTQIMVPFTATGLRFFFLFLKAFRCSVQDAYYIIIKRTQSTNSFTHIHTDCVHPSRQYLRLRSAPFVCLTNPQRSASAAPRFAILMEI